MGSGIDWPRPFGRYLLLAPLAQGGMGEVCLALSGALSGAERLCVVKTIRPDLAGDPEFIGRFMDEGRVSCALSHPNVAQVLEVGIEDQVPFVAMEYVSGEDLDRVMQAAQRKGTALSLDFVFTTIAGVLEGLSYVHKASSLDGAPLNLVHRDISPQNVRTSWEGDVKILDFGAARAAVRQTHTVHGVVFGKPGYMAPEQARGEELDLRADLYAVGIVTWELLAGAEMARDRTMKHMKAVAHGTFQIPPLRGFRPDVPHNVDEWIEALCRHDRQERFNDAAAARRALLAIARESRIRVDRESVVDVLEALLPAERASSRAYVTSLVSQGRASRDSGNMEASRRMSMASISRKAQTEGSPEITAKDVLPGTRYRVGALLGSGGMGEVFAAEHADLGRQVALKVLYPAQSEDPAVARRFRMEARAIASLSHPNLVQVLDFGTTGEGRLFYAMERLVGETLRERVRSQGRLTPQEAVKIGAAVARGLSAAHAAGLVHRDLKPENIFLLRDGGVKLLDFGVAKATDPSFMAGAEVNTTRAGELFGSPAYMAPEQAAARPVDARTDLYALGVVLYEMLTGKPPFEGATMVELLARQLNETPKPMEQRVPGVKVPRALEDVVMGCLAKEPSQRPSSAAELATRLEDAVGLVSSPDGALGVGARASAPGTRVGRGPVMLLAGAVVVAVAAAGIAVVAMRHSGSGTQATPSPASTTATNTTTPIAPSTSVATTTPIAPVPTTAPAIDPAANTQPGSVVIAPPVPSTAPTEPVAPPPLPPPPVGNTAPGTTVAGSSVTGTPPVEPPVPVVPPPGTSTTVVVAPPPMPPGPPVPVNPPVADTPRHPQGQANGHVPDRRPTTMPVIPTPPPPRNTGLTSVGATGDHYAAARSALGAGQNDVAIREASAAIAAHQHPTESRVLLGQAYIRSGNRAAAVTQWRMVLARDPGNAEARHLLTATGEHVDP